MILRVLLILSLSAVCLFAQAQAGSNQFSLSGIITDEKANPIANSTVSIFKTADSSQAGAAISDEKGRFDLTVIPGHYFLKISFLSYDEKIVDSVIISDKDY